ncbi:L,D-transpeptidase family protein [Hymenobacter sp. 15J16-1T3B]|uniref:L,D-transpeptidase family protein n=1 Tax=Hymenobacter sp. 15J16-1T3B TaxID=2886941 RepID=UPI001D130484|nr:L,D-transpeptidase family protein [Hymenobacter sp. 15J16-1T3B]MCC3156690.1 L,D-transpeptidase family protein [Hymenobacter sp. 15J16-1T3B]
MSYPALLLTAALLLLARPCAERQRSASARPRATDPVSRHIRRLLRGNPADTASWQSPAAVRALYDTAAAPLWTQAAGLTPAAEDLLDLLARAPAYGLQPAYYALADLRAAADSLAPRPDSAQAQRRARFDVALSDAVLTLMRDLHRGRLHPAVPSPLEHGPGGAFLPAERLRAGLAAGRVAAAVLACQPPHRAYRQLQRALARWLQDSAAAVSGGPGQRRYQQVALTLERWRWQAPADSEYALINLPTFELQVVRGDTVLRRHRVIIGKPQTPTPTLRSRITSFTLAPDWHVPRSIATKEILPRLRGDAGYLARNNYTLYSAQGQVLDPGQVNWQRVTAQNFAYSIRQSAGCDNALGNIVFRFPNPYNVYLHDTPMRQFFEQPQRAFSHGCIRLEQPLQLAAYLLRRDGRPVRLPDEAACARQSRPRNVALRRPLPLHICYATCGVEQGQLRFYADLYHRDEALRQALFGRARPGCPADHHANSQATTAVFHDIRH